MSTITIKRIESESILSNCAAILVDAYNGEPWQDRWTQEKALEKLNCFYHSPKFLGWLAYLDNQLVGCSVGNIEPYFTGDYFYLKEMFVARAAQGKGVGAALLKSIKQYLASADIETIILFTAKGKGYPFDFYQKKGFAEMEGMRMMGFGEAE